MNISDYHFGQLDKKQFGKAFGKEMHRIKKNYPVFFYDEYRYQGMFHKEISQWVKCRKYGYIRRPAFKLDGYRIAITDNKFINDYYISAFTEGDLIYFSDSVQAIYMLDYLYSEYERQLINIPLLITDKIELVPSWIYVLKKLPNTAQYIDEPSKEGRLQKQEKQDIDDYNNNFDDILHLNGDEIQILNIIDSLTELHADGVRIEDVVETGDATGIQNIDEKIENLIKFGEIYYSSQRSRIKLMK